MKIKLLILAALLMTVWLIGRYNISHAVDPNLVQSLRSMTDSELAAPLGQCVRGERGWASIPEFERRCAVVCDVSAERGNPCP